MARVVYISSRGRPDGAMSTARAPCSVSTQLHSAAPLAAWFMYLATLETVASAASTTKLQPAASSTPTA